jgi:hypothetical protein
MATDATVTREEIPGGAPQPRTPGCPGSKASHTGPPARRTNVEHGACGERERRSEERVALQSSAWERHRFHLCGVLANTQSHVEGSLSYIGRRNRGTVPTVAPARARARAPRWPRRRNVHRRRLFGPTRALRSAPSPGTPMARETNRRRSSQPQCNVLMHVRPPPWPPRRHPRAWCGSGNTSPSSAWHMSGRPASKRTRRGWIRSSSRSCLWEPGAPCHGPPL